MSPDDPNTYRGEDAPSWIEPTFQQREGEVFPIVLDPSEIAGRTVITGLALPWCGAEAPDTEPFGYPLICGLVFGHDGDHWRCTPELVVRDGAFALMRSVLEPAEEARSDA